MIQSVTRGIERKSLRDHIKAELDLPKETSYSEEDKIRDRNDNYREAFRRLLEVLVINKQLDEQELHHILQGHFYVDPPQFSELDWLGNEE